MKTALSLPDDLFEAAEAEARRRNLSRSRLYSLALQEFLERHEAASVREKLDQVYGAEPSTVDEPLSRAQLKTLDSDEW